MDVSKKVKEFIESHYLINPGEFKLVQLFFLSMMFISIFISTASIVGITLLLNHVSGVELRYYLALFFIVMGLATFSFDWLYNKLLGCVVN